MEGCPNYAKSAARCDGKCCRFAQHRTVKVADHHRVRACLAGLNPRDRVAVTGSGADRLAVEEPLIIEAWGARCYYGEGDASTSSDRLPLRLTDDHWGRRG